MEPSVFLATCLPGAPITKRRVQHKPHECLNPTSVSKQRCRDSCGLSSSFVGARYGKTLTSQFHLKPRTTRQPQDTIDGHTRLVTIDWRLSCDFHVHLASWNSLGALRLYAWKLQLTVDFQASRRCVPDISTITQRLDHLTSVPTSEAESETLRWRCR